MAIGNVRPFVLDTSGFDNALSGMFAGIKQRRQDAEYGDLLNTLAAPPQTANNAVVPVGGQGVPPVLQADYGRNALAGSTLNDRIKQFEGYTPKASWDYKQNSVGYGTRAKYPGEVIDKAEAERRLSTEVDNARGIVERFAPNAPPGVKDALTSLTYNAGADWTTAGLGQAVKRGDWEDAKRRFVQYNKAGGKTLPGLVNRRKSEVQWFDGGQQPVRTADAGDGRSAALEWARRNPGHPAAKAIGQEVLSQQLDPMASVKQQQAQANLQNTLTEQQRSQVEFFGKRAMAIQQMSPEIRARVWPQVLAELQRAFPNDPIDPEEADPETGPQILAAQAGMLLDPMAGEERRLKMEQLRAETAKTQREAQAGPSTVKGAPPGYSWIDPNNPEAGVKPLPGFEKPIPGDVAGKVAMMSMARKNIENSRGTFERPWNAGDVAKFGAANVPLVGDIGMLSGDVGMALRDIRVGVEAALRTMTGAAAPEQEVRRYVDMFSPRPTDTSDVVRQKIDGLMQFMADAERLVVQGRGVDPGMIPQQTAPQSPTQAAPTQASAPRSKQEYDALPSGTQYTAPDGSVRVKP